MLNNITEMDGILLNIESLAYGGSGIARHEGLVYFVQGGVPGDVVRVRVTKNEKRYREAEILEIIKASKHRISPPCKYSNECGGCQWQHIEYKLQISSKLNELKSAISKAGISLQKDSISEAVESPKKLYYRRTARFKVAFNKDSSKPIIGFYAEKSRKIVEIDKCLIVDEMINEKLKEVKIKNPKIIGFDLFLDNSGKVHTINRFSETDEGADFIQVNEKVNQLMISHIIKAAKVLKDGFSVIDLFCGDGNLSLGLAPRASSILGWDYSKGATKRGRNKAAEISKDAAGCDITYLKADIFKDWDKIAKRSSKADLLIMDPPRRGLKKLCRNIIDLNIPLVLYISCSPPALARDLKLFTENDYTIEQIKPFDMFPQTYHLETLAILRKGIN